MALHNFHVRFLPDPSSLRKGQNPILAYASATCPAISGTAPHTSPTPVFSWRLLSSTCLNNAMAEKSGGSNGSQQFHGLTEFKNSSLKCMTSVPPLAHLTTSNRLVVTDKGEQLLMSLRRCLDTGVPTLAIFYTLRIRTDICTVLGRHGSASLCRDERENKMAATYNVLAFKR